MSNSITLAGIGNVHTDAEGRYSLNDFHKAAGAVPHQKPSEWLSNKQTRELAEEIGKAGIPAYVTAKGGRNPGTYVVKELVYAYAMWISAPFQLRVIRAFDALVTGDIEKAQQIANPKASNTGLESKRKAEALMLGRDAAKAICDDLVLLCAEAKQVIYAKVLNPIAGHEVIPLPLLEEKFFTATQVGEQVGASANVVGRIANMYGLKTDQYGKFFLDKSRHSDKQVQAFRYNVAGLERIKELVAAEAVTE